jgi:hypothetical protein
MFYKKSLNRFVSVLWVFIWILSFYQPAIAAPVEAGQATPALLQFSSGGHVLGFTTGSMLAATGSHALRVDFVGANPVQPQSPASGSVQDKLAQLQRVTYVDLWDGINLDYSADAGSIYTSTYTLAPGANPATICLHYNAPLTLNNDGT